MKKYMVSLVALIFTVALGFGCAGGGGGGGGDGEGGGGGGGGSYVVFGYNDAGMNVMDADFSAMMISPPGNNLHAQLIRQGGQPAIISGNGGGAAIVYSIPNNTTSVTKTNFWTYVMDLLGVSPAPDVGLTGNGLSGNMTPTGKGDWAATGIPVTPLNDSLTPDYYQLADVTALMNGVTVASTKAVVSVSTEMNCGLCHGGGSISATTGILMDHDDMIGTNLESQKPALCANCHAQKPMGTTGSPSLSQAMHSSHEARVAELGLPNPCFACHPGNDAKYSRDVHFNAGMTCSNCHGSMADVGSAKRKPWVDEPRCGKCHSRPGFQFEQPGKLYRESRGHNGVLCLSCHGSPHAIAPSTVANDNWQANNLMGHAGTIDQCAVCHLGTPDDGFNHSASGGD